MAEPKAIKIDNEFDEDRCQGNKRAQGKNFGQCEFKAIPGTQYCAYCTTAGVTKSVRMTELRNYRLKIYKERVGELATNDAIKNLNEEIGILRLMLENILNLCDSDNALELNSAKISDLVLKIEKLVTSFQRMEQQTGQMLSKSQVVTIATNLTNIVDTVIKKHITNTGLIAAICGEIATETLKLMNNLSEVTSDPIED